MATGRVVVHFARVLGEGELGDPASDPVSATDLQALLAPRFLDRALELLPADAVDVIGYASTTTAYAIGFEAQAAVVSRLAERAGREWRWSARRGSTPTSTDLARAILL
jgi:hypothetical protein